MTITKKDISRDEYLQHLINDGPRSDKHQLALKHVHDIRKFEIELYWKRAAYFWTFIALIFAGYFVVVHADTYNATSAFSIACLGVVFSFAWYCVNRGSKAWQRNWETHLDLLEDEVTGPLYKTMLNRYDPKFRNLTGSYFFSPTKINHILSLYVAAIWLVLVVQSGIVIWTQFTIVTAWAPMIVAVISAGALSTFWLFGRTSESASEHTISFHQRTYATGAQETAPNHPDTA